MKIGVFDSGKGGEYITNGLRKLLPEHKYIVVNDREHVPYGSRSDDEVTILTDAAIQPLLTAGCGIIVIACNTATMAAIRTLRERYPATQFVGIEPMVKPAAAMSKTRHIIVLATPLTLKSEQYQTLISEYGNGIIIDQPSAAGWAAAIEFGRTSSIDFSEVRHHVKDHADTIVLACTHYIILKQQLATEFPTTMILEPTEAIARQITRLLAE